MSRLIDILLVDVEARNLDALEAVLARADYRLLRAGNADDALRLLLTCDVAVIVLNIETRGLGGFELARMIGDTTRSRNIPIVCLTVGTTDDRNLVAADDAGGIDYLRKPVHPEILRYKVGAFADRHRAIRECIDPASTNRAAAR